MQSLSAEQILAVWEAGRPQHPLDRALTLLGAATPGASRDALADLSIGERDARLLQLRTIILGSRAEGFAECPECGERLEFPLDTASFALPPPGVVSPLRLPTSRDLAEIVAAPDPATALQLLATLCGGSAHSPNESIETLSHALLAADPRAEIVLNFSCPVCAHSWELIFDIAEFFWTEISAQAQRLLREIDALARAYGWTEREILGLPPARRQTYLDLLAA